MVRGNAAEPTCYVPTDRQTTIINSGAPAFIGPTDAKARSRQFRNFKQMTKVKLMSRLVADDDT
jgi:hypothetical protein